MTAHGKTVRKYILYIVIAVLLITAALFGVYQYVNKIVVQANIESMRELAEHDKQAMGVSLRNRVTAAENLADSLASQSILSIQGLHESLFAANYQLKTKKIYLLGSNGKFYSSNGTAKEDADYARMVSEHPDGFIDRVPSTSKKFDDSILLIGRPISGLSVEGVSFTYIITETKLQDLNSELVIRSYQNRGRSAIIDAEGNYIVNDNGRLQENAFEALHTNGQISGMTMDTYIQKIITEPDTAVTITLEGKPYISLTSAMEQGWIFVTYCPVSVFEEESNKLAALFAGLAVVMTAAVAAVVILILKSQSRKNLQEKYEEIQMLNEQLVENQSRLEESVAEQESQLEEITALNHELEENQAQLEETTAEQESQLEEIAALNHELEEHQAQLEETAAEQESQLEEIAALNKTLTAKQEELEFTIRDLAESDGVIRAAGYGIWKFVFDAEGNVCGLLGNDKWSEIFGVENDTMTPEERFAYYNNGLDDGSKSEVHDDYSLMREGIVKSRVFAWNHPTKGKIYLSVGGTKHIARNGDVQISGYVTDVTEETVKQQEWENKILKAQKLAEDANAAKTSFLFNMSHDIRTPMNAIMGFRDLLEKHQNEPEKRADYLRKIEDSSTVLLSIINNVLEMARIEKGTIEIDETAWSAEQFNDTLYSIFHEMMAQKKITFTRKVNVQNQYVFCDPIKLREIFINILSNAYKYTNSGGSVSMLLEEIPSDREGYAYYRTTITDTGIGMSEEFLPHIFDEFSREQNTTDAKIEGTGLGMPIVKRLVALMDGTIEVKSTKGVGSTFIVTIPHRIAEKSRLVEHAGVEIDPNLFIGKRILLAEDNELNAEIAFEILGEAGFIVERAEDGAICVDMLERSADGYYDLILMDIQMPNMNGYEATRAIRQLGDRNKAKINILAMTANAFEEDKREALRAGMNGHLAKPINVTELMKALAGILG